MHGCSALGTEDGFLVSLVKQSAVLSLDSSDDEPVLMRPMRELSLDLSDDAPLVVRVRLRKKIKPPKVEYNERQED